MRHFSIRALAVALVCVGAGATAARAQYYAIANQLPSLISPALSGSFNYKGIVEAGFTGGFSTNKANFVSFSTSQGFQYSSWFFMGVGLGVDITMRNNDLGDNSTHPGYWDHSTVLTGCMIPLFTDFRFTLGSSNVANAFIDLKVGATFLIGNDYMEFHDGYLSNSGNFYLKPTIGIRIPVSNQNPKQAFTVGVSYQLITSGNNYNWYGGNTLTINSVGATVGYEW